MTRQSAAPRSLEMVLTVRFLEETAAADEKQGETDARVTGKIDARDGMSILLPKSERSTLRFPPLSSLSLTFLSSSPSASPIR